MFSGHPGLVLLSYGHKYLNEYCPRNMRLLPWLFPSCIPRLPCLSATETLAVLSDEMAVSRVTSNPAFRVEDFNVLGGLLTIRNLYINNPGHLKDHFYAKNSMAAFFDAFVQNDSRSKGFNMINWGCIYWNPEYALRCMLKESKSDGALERVIRKAVTEDASFRFSLAPFIGELVDHSFVDSVKAGRKPPGSSKEEPKGPKDEEPKESKNDETKAHKKPRRDDDEPEPSYRWIKYLGYGLAAYLLLSLIDFGNLLGMGAKQISFQEFLQSSTFRKGRVEKLVVSDDKTQVLVLQRQDADLDDDPLESRLPLMFTIGSLEAFERALKDAEDELEDDSPQYRRIPVIYNPPPRQSILIKLLELTSALLPILFLVFLFRSFRGTMGRPGSGGPLGNIFNMTKSKAKLYNAETAVKVSFKDVAGMDEAKEEVSEFVKFLKTPQVYERLGAKIPKGAILSGPPGTGKTLLAKAIAGEAAVPFYSVSGSEFVEMFVGLGSSRVKDLFEEAKKNSPCIIFIDEIDAIGKARSRSGMGANDERENTLNQLLVEMDGFETDQHVVVLAGTNRPDILDPALTRPGRFDRHIRIDKPDVQGRKDIYLVHLKPIKLDPKSSMADVALRLAYMTPGFAGADIANVCNESALIAARRDAQFVTVHDLEAAVERVIAGIEKKSRVLSPEERSIVAHHEAGHAVAAWFLEHAEPVMKVTIIPRSSGALGFARTLPSDNYLLSRDQLLDRLCVTLGGRVAEEIFYSHGQITSGAQNDLEKVTKWAYDAIAVLGLDNTVGPLSFPPREDLAKMYSESTAQLLDERAKKLILHAHERTTQLLTKHKDQMKALAKLLLDKESIVREDIETVLGPRPFSSKHGYDEYVKAEKLK